jgi:hypothetical protein
VEALNVDLVHLFKNRVRNNDVLKVGTVLDEVNLVLGKLVVNNEHFVNCLSIFFVRVLGSHFYVDFSRVVSDFDLNSATF